MCRPSLVAPLRFKPDAHKELQILQIRRKYHQKLLLHKLPPNTLQMSGYVVASEGTAEPGYCAANSLAGIVPSTTQGASVNPFAARIWAGFVITPMSTKPLQHSTWMPHQLCSRKPTAQTTVFESCTEQYGLAVTRLTVLSYRTKL